MVPSNGPRLDRVDRATGEVLDMFVKLIGRFATRREADLAIEHLVQEHGIERTDIFVQSAVDANTAGVRIGGADRASGEPGTGTRGDAPLEGEVELSVEVARDKVATVRNDLKEADARDIREE